MPTFLEAKQLIGKYTTEDSYVNDNFDADYQGEETGFVSNQSDLSNYYQECELVILEFINRKK